MYIYFCITTYESGEQRILTEMNREKLPSFVEALKKPGYMDVRPLRVLGLMTSRLMKCKQVWEWKLG
ncbi:hypothetical protein GTQ43_16815 [Nostoc sp. KVJ3]|uniref:hypothetical protein n=1 Tax=Nostoc sp. KVJ3 TaxID=457945 RepID=UPI002237DBA3|nr:hypothetical protein [Nostoc sp. KVJ3]MCW5315408.1 hypothetical protein [Nostoc sp. KVJ3]